MKKIIVRLFPLAGIVFASCTVVGAQCTPSITFENRSGSDALARVVGASTAEVGVPDGTSAVVSVPGGVYFTVVRYGAPGNYTYSRGDSFAVVQRQTQGGSSCSRIAITLHKVRDGNYGSRPSSKGEFDGAR